MTDTHRTTVDAPAGNSWLPTPRGVALVTRIELMRRQPSRKGYIMYGIVLALILVLGIVVAAQSPDVLDSAPLELVLVLVLIAGMLIAPSLSATSINGDSGEGVLAPLQMTRLTAGDLAWGKLFASWLVAVAVLVTMTPFLAYAFMRSGWRWHELLIVIAVILGVVLVSTAIGLAWSSIAARAVASVSMAHVTTGVLIIGTLVLYAISLPLVSEERIETQSFVDWDRLSADEQVALDTFYITGNASGLRDSDVASWCTQSTYVTYIHHTDRTVWLLLLNPAVVIGESSPIVSPKTYEEDGRAMPGLFASMHQQVSSARIGPREPGDSDNYDECGYLEAMVSSGSSDDPMAEQQDDWAQRQAEEYTYGRAPWLGLGVQTVLLIGSMALVVQRLRVPYKNLRVGTRVA